MGIQSRGLKWATRECGCQLLEKANALPDLDQKKPQAVAYALKVKARWGCGAPRKGPLPPMLEAIRAQVGKALGADLEPGQCPFLVLYQDTEWVSEVVRAEGLAREAKVPWPDALGRPLTAVDTAAIASLQVARANVHRLEQKHDRAERKRKGTPYPGDDDEDDE